ncbi:bacteriophage N4 adsorption B protein [Thalictrum thalictroides]|uniref:Bacteriophage N4 adsorption B protein n=1 Tax=Thalictrum thalictroides TaxID=46969 RepID=A0A7J6WJT2_THATH|nr:bacteriophage N4 adsorption B protein [Thalictrum thalictroides]
MPTFTSVTLDRFLEPGGVGGGGGEAISYSPKRNMSTTTTTTTMVEKKAFNSSDNNSSSFSFPPSPYSSSNNNKRNEMPLLFKNFPQGERADVSEKEEVSNGRNFNGKNLFVAAPVFSFKEDVVKSYEKSNGFPNGNGNGNGMIHNISLDPSGDSSSHVSEDFFDPRDSLSVASSVETEDFIGNERTFKLNTPTAEFYDAYEELSEVCSQSSLRDVEAELRELKMSLLMEIEGRKQAEEMVDIMKRQWERLAQKLLLEGLKLPAASTIVAEDEKLETDPAEELCKQIRLARAVSTSVGKEAAKAEADLELESKMEAKNFEIARLEQRLHYYETVNSEMALRNQEATGMARRLAQRRKRRQRWMWGTIGVGVVCGSMALAWSFLPTASGSPPTDPAPECDTAANELPN